MRNRIFVALLTLVSLLSFTGSAAAARVVVRRPRPVVRVRVAPRVYLPRVTFRAAVVALPPASARAWSDSETLARADGWSDFVMNVDQRGKSMLLEIDRGTAQMRSAEVVFENGEAQVVDFNDRVHASGVYSLIDFADGRKVDHVRVVAKADSREAVIRLHLVR